MIKQILLLVIFVSQYSYACRCANERDLARIVADSKTIFVGETIGVERIGELVDSGESQRYKIIISPVEILKGKPQNKYVFKGNAIYNSIKSNEITVGGCNRNMEMGEYTLVMLELGKEIEWTGCSENLIYIEPETYEKFIREFKANL